MGWSLVSLYFLRVALEYVEGLSVGLEVEFGFPVVTTCVVCAYEVMGGWLLCSRCTCGVFIYGGVGVREGVRVCYGLCGALFSVGVEVSEGRRACDELFGVLLSCIVGYGVIRGLTGVMFVFLKARGVVTGGVA